MPRTREAPDLGHGDKVNHIAAFVTLSVAGGVGVAAGARCGTIAVLMSAFGAAIEGLQALPVIARDAEWADWYADTAAVAVALLVVAVVRRLRATSSAR